MSNLRRLKLTETDEITEDGVKVLPNRTTPSGRTAGNQAPHTVTLVEGESFSIQCRSPHSTVTDS